MRKRTPKPIDLKSLDLVIAFDQSLPRERNSLFTDKSNRLFIADTDNWGQKVLRQPGAFYFPIEESLPTDFEEVSLKYALAWYARCNPWACGSTGSVELLCELAAKRLKE